ncbi:MAG: 23S rRNA methyltransferase [Pirellulaceae bacterium]|nr:MAG: 23S rRNA methyltransferase [Pirellulaceae bacterium]
MLPLITSPTNHRVKHWVRLRRSDVRRQCGEFLIDGRQEVEKAVAAGIEVCTLLIPGDDLADPETVARVTSLVSEHVVQPLGPAAMRRVSYGQRDRDWIAVARVRTERLTALAFPPCPLILVLDRLEKPGNIGACLRSAAAVGASAVLLADCPTDLYNPNAIRASRGAIFQLPVVQCGSAEAIELLRRHDVPICAAEVDAPQSFWETDLSGAVAIAIGNEADGLQEVWRQSATTRFRVPMQAHTDSLNASISAALCLYEAQRQRQFAGNGRKKFDDPIVGG